jgi:hypothetical protein
MVCHLELGDCHLERSEAPAERSRKTPLLCGSHEKQVCISTTSRVLQPDIARVPYPNLSCDG